MATQVQLRRGTSTQNDSFTGAQGELTFDTTNKRVRIHDGATAGGFELKTENAGGDTLFATGEKAIFGAGSDLQIYHDGANSVINEGGTGELRLGGTNLRLGNGGLTETYLLANNQGAVTLYYDNNPTLATTSTGIDVTGTVTADGLTVETAQGNISIENGVSSLNFARAGGNYIRALDASGNFTFITGANNFTTTRLKIENDGDISFYEATGTTPKFFWDSSAEGLALGQTTLLNNGTLTVKGEGKQAVVAQVTNNANSLIQGFNSSTALAFQVTGAGTGYFAGNVGIGTSSPDGLLKATSGSSPNASQLLIGYNGTSENYFDANTQIFRNGSFAEKMRIDSSGHAIIPAGVTLGTAVGVYAAANTLDDYEEGTWTPTIDGSSSASGQTYTTRSGGYIKVGKMVTANFRILLSAKGTINGSLRINGLPFVGNNEPPYQTATLMSGNVDIDKDQQLTGMQYAVNAFIYLMIQESDLALSQPSGTAILKDNTEISGSITYFTNS